MAMTEQEMQEAKNAVLTIAKRFSVALQDRDRDGALAALAEGQRDYPDTPHLPQGFTWATCQSVLAKALPEPVAAPAKPRTAKAKAAKPATMSGINLDVVADGRSDAAKARTANLQAIRAEASGRKVLTLSRELEFGTIIRGTSLGDGAAKIIGKAGLGWGWAGRYGHFYLGDRDIAPDMDAIAEAVRQLEASGLFVVAGTVDPDAPAGAAPAKPAKRLTGPQQARFDTAKLDLDWQLLMSTNGVKCADAVCPTRLRADDAVIVTGVTGRPHAVCSVHAETAPAAPAKPRTARHAEAAPAKPRTTRAKAAAPVAQPAPAPAVATGLEHLSTGDLFMKFAAQDTAALAEVARRLAALEGAAKAPVAPAAPVETGPLTMVYALSPGAHAKKTAQAARQGIYAGYTSRQAQRPEIHVYTAKDGTTLTVTAVLPAGTERASAHSGLAAALAGVRGVGTRMN